MISSLLKSVSGLTHACKVSESFNTLCNLCTFTKVFPGIFNELPKFKTLPVGVADINTFFTGFPALKLTLPVITAVGFLYPTPII